MYQIFYTFFLILLFHIAINDCPYHLSLLAKYVVYYIRLVKFTSFMDDKRNTKNQRVNVTVKYPSRFV